MLHVFKQEEDQDAGGGSNADEIISMCRNNLVDAQKVIVQLVPILGMYSDNYLVKLPRRPSRYAGLV